MCIHILFNLQLKLASLHGRSLGRDATLEEPTSQVSELRPKEGEGPSSLAQHTPLTSPRLGVASFCLVLLFE